MRVLVVEDSSPVRERLLVLLRDLPHVEAVAAADTREARAHLTRGRFDAVVLDIHLAGESGLCLIEEVKRRTPASVVVVLTNDASEVHRRSCLGRGANHFLDKSHEFERAIELVTSSVVR
ncbi:MAG TPA: response regulator [Polyangiaceae bacterium]